MNPRLVAAIEWAELGVAALPCRGKDAGGYVRKGWPEKASTDPAQLEEWWQRWPYANPGVVPHGAALLIDVDRPEVLERLERETEPAPPVPRYYTNGEPAGGGAWTAAPRKRMHCPLRITSAICATALVASASTTTLPPS